MQVILKEKVPHLGNIGDVVVAKGGFVRNYLLPKGKALLATPQNLEQVKIQQAELEKIAAENFSAAKGRYEKLNANSVTMKARAGEGGKLFGSIGTKDIAEAISQALCPIEKSEVRLPLGSIRTTGDYEIEIALHPDVMAIVMCKIVPEEI